MFIENIRLENPRRGFIEVICGSMFSGKTEELIRRLKRAKYAKQRVEIFKPAIDQRYDEKKVVSHDDNAIHSTPIKSAAEILPMATNIEVVGVDEAQFFEDDLVAVCNHLANKGIRVIVAGLDMDYLGVPFGPIPQLVATAEYVTKVHAICVKCGSLANHSHRIVKEETLVMVGEMEAYEPLCRLCFSQLYPPLLNPETGSMANVSNVDLD
ncbi:MAG: thymidine kinase [Flavobacteriales bacterium]|nr:thymidine kinase [Flavobacteriales bacterium]